MGLKFFVIMPSGKKGEYKFGTNEADFVYKEIICKAINQALVESYGTSDQEVSIEREIDELSPGAINKSIVRKTAHADYVIVDITGTNPNVFFELGLRYAFKSRGTILIRQEDSYIPFDVSAYRCIDYDSKFFGVESAITQIKEALLSLIHKDQVDSLVYDTFPHLTLTFDKVYQSEIEDNTVMNWGYFWGKFKQCLHILEQSGYQPDYIVGISNGGMFLADSVSRLLYPKVPIVSFWANRTHPNKDFFANSINEAVISVVKEKEADKAELKLLIFDDIVATGVTWVKFKEFIHSHLKKYSIVFVPLFSRSKKYLESIEQDTMWAHEIFRPYLPTNMSFENFCYTDFLQLPYSKEINFNK